MFKVQLMPSRRYRGFTALELIIVLVVGFSIIGLAAGKMNNMMDSSKAVRALDSILTLTTNVQSLNGPTGYGTADYNLVPDLVNAGLVPKSLKVTNHGRQPATIHNPWNEMVIVTVDGTDNQKFNIMYSGVSKTACSKLLKDLLPNYTVHVLAGTQVRPTNNTLVQGNANAHTIINECNRNQGNAVVLHLTPL